MTEPGHTVADSDAADAVHDRFGIPQPKVEDTIEKLKQRARVYEPQSGVIRTT